MQRKNLILLALFRRPLTVTQLEQALNTRLQDENPYKDDGRNLERDCHNWRREGDINWECSADPMILTPKGREQVQNSRLWQFIVAEWSAGGPPRLSFEERSSS